MKKWTLPLLFLFIFTTIFAQKSDQILLNQEVLNLEANTLSFNAKSFPEQVWGGNLYLLIQFHKPLTSTELSHLKKANIELLTYLDNLAYIARIPTSISAQELQKYGIRHVGFLNAKNKINPSFQQKSGNLNVLIQLYRAEDKAAALKQLSNIGKLTERSFLSKPNGIYLQTTAERLQEIAQFPFVQYIQGAYQAKPFIDENLIVHQANYLQHPTGLNLSGNGVVVGIGDGGTINHHLDLNDRIINRNEIDDSEHASTVSGIIAGEGILDDKASGFAPSTLLIADYYRNMVSKAITYYNNNGMTLANHSYGTFPDDIPFCGFSGNYDSYSQDIDQTTFLQHEILHFVAAGNSGGGSCAPYPAGYNTIFNGIQAAKNVLTVGATVYDDVIWNNSSRGPTTDGRIKPEIVAVGVNVRATNATQGYGNGSGTSFSTPSVTGAAALLTQLYKSQHNDSIPEAALLKAILCNSADDLGNVGPDYIYGFGRMNALKAAQIIEANHHISDTISQAQSHTYTITVPANVESMKVMLCWTEPAASPLSTAALINNLDFEIEDPNALTHYPWLLDTAATQVGNIAFRGNASDRDSINNIEQITIEHPIAGSYDIRVLGTSIPAGVQKFHVVYEMVEKELVLTHPLGGEVFLPSEDLLITWEDTTAFSGDTFSLYYSEDNGANWTTIQTGIAPTATQYLFTRPNIVSDEMLIRIANSNETFADTSAQFTVMGGTSLSATPDCSEQVNLSWTAVANASSYEVFQFISGSWNSIHITASTSHTVSNLNAGEEYCFTVQTTSLDGVKGGNAIGKCVTAFGNLVNTFPYQEDFETTDGNWVSAGKNNEWEWGTPNNLLLDCAADGDKAWVTDLDGNYSDAGLAYLYSPCFDLSNLTMPVLSFSLWLDVENNEATPEDFYDYVQVQYSNNDINWSRLGMNGGGYHWYNNQGDKNIWDGTFSTWQQVRYNIPNTQNNVRFRILLNSDPYTTQEGAGIDNVYIYDAADEAHFVQLRSRVLLQGNFEEAQNLMHDSLRTQSHIPLQESYSAIFTQVGNGGGAEITDVNILNTTGNDAIVDWVFLELRSKTDSANVVATRSALVQRDGDIVDTDGVGPVKFFGVQADDFYIAIKYRNHLGVMTEAVVELANILLRE